MKEIQSDRVSVVTLTKAGKSVKEIQKITARSATFIHKWRLRSREGDRSLEDKPRAGRPGILDSSSKNFLKKKMYGVVRASPREMAKQLAKKKMFAFLLALLQDLRNLKTGNRIGFRKRLCSPKKNRSSRLQFVGKYGKLKEDDWKKWLFTDEKNFVLFRPPNAQNDRVYCLSKEEVRPQMIPKYSQSVMVWGGISAAGRTKLIFLKKGQRLSSNTYVSDILEPAVADIKGRTSKRVTPWLTKRLFRDPVDWVFQQDSAPPHRGKIATGWLQKNVPAFLPPSEWPGNSPDLNPMEHI
jgi:hypothetical protein